jgi:hypothetical protein
MLTRNPDGTVNAERGDAVEVWNGMTWQSFEYFREGKDDYIICIQPRPYPDSPRLHAPIEHVRHARGGAGHLRLQVAQLRAFIESDVMPVMQDIGESGKVLKFLADIDNYEYAEPQP